MQGQLRAGAVLGALTLAATLGSPGLASAGSDDEARIPAKYLNQEVTWVDCTEDGSVQCALIKSPMDWNRAATSPAIDIAVSRSSAAGSSKRRLVIGNPGGPGAPGLGMAPLLAMQPGLSDHLAVGFDVRGTGSSSNISCLGAPTWTADVRDRRRATLDRVAAISKVQQSYCRKASGPLLDYITTDQTVADMNLIRALLGYRVTDYVGYSGGTWLGAYYQKYFPRHVGRFVLDSNADFTLRWNNTFGPQAEGFQRRFEADFQQWAAGYDAELGLGATAPEVNAFYERLRQDLVRRPLDLEADGQVLHVDGNLLDTLTIQMLYSKYYFPLLAATYGELRAMWDGGSARSGDVAATREVLRRIHPATGANQPIGAPDAYPSTFTAITCNDWPWPGTQAFADRRAGELGRDYPLVGWGYNRNACYYWKRPNVRLQVPDAQGIGTTVMVQSANDPATNSALARHAHNNYPGSILIWVRKEGDHGIYSGDNTCVNDMVNRYLATGRAPAGDRVCVGVGLPELGKTANPSPREQLYRLGRTISF